VVTGKIRLKQRLILTTLVNIPTESNLIRLNFGVTMEGRIIMKAKKKPAKKAKKTAKKKKR